jgi:hypothetical protein
MRWRKSNYSKGDSACVELGEADDGTVHIRNSKSPDRGTLTITPAALAAFIAACTTGTLDHHTT